MKFLIAVFYEEAKEPAKKSYGMNRDPGSRKERALNYQEHKNVRDGERERLGEFSWFEGACTAASLRSLFAGEGLGEKEAEPRWESVKS